MIEYYKITGKIKFICKSKIQYIYKISDNRVYFYDNGTKHWVLSIHATKQYLFRRYDLTTLTLLNIVMLGIPE